MRLSAAGDVTARRQLRRGLAVRQTIGVKLFCKRDGIGPCFGIRLAAAQLSRPFAGFSKLAHQTALFVFGEAAGATDQWCRLGRRQML
jgi:hypothetical protein